MISVQSALLVALGFLIASLLGVLIGSALWARAVRLTTARIKQSMPVSEGEIQADRDRLRAEFALKVHRLEANLDQVKLERARQFIELNRRDASIGSLQTQLADLRAEVEEHGNARRVLEQTVADRLPRVEARLAEAKRLLFNRDREIAELTTGAKRHKLALEEASSLTAQQSAKIDKLTSELSTRARVAPAEARFENELTLRTEVETLRAKTREQGMLIERLQQRLGEQGYRQEAAARTAESVQQAQEIARLRQKLSDAEGTLSAVRAAGSDSDAAHIAFESQLRALTSRLEDQSAEIARLNAALAVFDRFDGKPGGVKESKLLLKARLSSAQSHSDQQAGIIGRLRAELAAMQERLQRQAENFAAEMRRAEQPPIAGPGPARRRLARLTEDGLAGRVAEVRPAVSEPAERNGAVKELASQIKRAQVRIDTAQEAAPEEASAPARPPDVVSERLHASQGAESWTDLTHDAAAAARHAQPTGEAGTAHHPANGGGNGNGNGNGSERGEDAGLAQDLPQAAPILPERLRPRLLDRLSSMAKG